MSWNIPLQGNALREAHRICPIAALRRVVRILEIRHLCRINLAIDIVDITVDIEHTRPRRNDDIDVPRGLQRPSQQTHHRHRKRRQQGNVSIQTSAATLASVMFLLYPYKLQLLPCIKIVTLPNYHSTNQAPTQRTWRCGARLSTIGHTNLPVHHLPVTGAAVDSQSQTLEKPFGQILASGNRSKLALHNWPGFVYCKRSSATPATAALLDSSCYRAVRSGTGPVAQPVFKTGEAWQPHAGSVRLRGRSVTFTLRIRPPMVAHLPLFERLHALDSCQQDAEEGKLLPAVRAREETTQGQARPVDAGKSRSRARRPRLTCKEFKKP